MSEDILSVLGHRWLARAHDPREALAISQQLGLPEIMGRILASRGVTAAGAEAFLKPTLREFLPDPFLLKDMEKAARRIAEEVIRGQHFLPPQGGGEEGGAISDIIANNAPTPPSPYGGGRSESHLPSPTIAIFGDYDVDGATSSALLIRYLRALSLAPLVHIPDRMKEGYGPNTPALLSLKERGATLIITVDCGTMAFEPLRAAKLSGLDVIVVDHHKGDAQMPETYALVNPNRFDETSLHTQLAACGVTFLLLVAVNKILRESGLTGPDLLPFLDLVALGTICDVVPLTGANRALVTQGLKILHARSNMGIAAAQDTAKLAEAPGIYHAGFIIGPRINAGGRVGKSDLGVRLLTTDDPLEARSIAEELNRLNTERKAIESLVMDEAMQDALALPASDAVIMVARKGWHAGVIGIVASRLKDHFHKPTAVIALADGIGKASARSMSGIDLGEAVVAAMHKGLLLGGGGHAMAAGFTVAEPQLGPLRDFFNQAFAAKILALGKERTLCIDGIISLQGLTAELVHLIDRAGPFGAGHSSVRFQLAPVRVVNATIAGSNHVRAIVVDAGTGAPSGSLKVMAFRSVGTPVGEALLHSKGRPMHLAGQARLNQWQGRETVDFFIDDVAF